MQSRFDSSKFKRVAKTTLEEHALTKKRDEAMATPTIMLAGISPASTTDIRTSASGASPSVGGTIPNDSKRLRRHQLEALPSNTAVAMRSARR